MLVIFLLGLFIYTNAKMNVLVMLKAAFMIKNTVKTIKFEILLAYCFMFKYILK